MKIAAVQCDVLWQDPEGNLARVAGRLQAAASAGAVLTVFPECMLTGYCFESADEARAVAQPIPGPATDRLAVLCRELGVHAVVGMIEADGPRLYNAAVLVGPLGLIASYRKVHLPMLGLDRLVSYGDRPFAVHQAGPLRVGLNICYDVSFPESARSLALLGADLVALPTNWPPGAECIAGHVLNARALENGVYLAAANRVGAERGFVFIGQSRICDPAGRTLAQSDGREETILYADLDPALARQKHIVRVRGRHEIDRMADRRPEMYSQITQPHQLERPGRRR